MKPLQTLVAEDGGQLLGFIGYEHNGHIDHVFTSPTAARRGVELRRFVMVKTVDGYGEDLSKAVRL